MVLETAQVRAKERAQQAAQQTADGAKDEIGRRAFDTLEEYFPEQAAERRRQNQTAVFLVGLAVGFALGVLVGR